MKGISDFISTVLIIAITITVGIALFNWIEPLSRQHAEDIKEDSTNKIKCQDASIRIMTGKLNTTSGKVSVLGENTGVVNLANFTFNVLLTNGTNINSDATPAVTLSPSNQQTFTSEDNITVNVNLLDSVRLIGKCNGVITIHDDLDGNTFTTV